VIVAQEAPRQAEVLVLLEAARTLSQSLYPPESIHQLDITRLELPSVRFFVARIDGVAVGCGAFKMDAPGEAELKSMFVAEAARRAGVGAAILRTVETAAVAAGARLLLLETGIHHVAAQRMYAREGYVRRGPYGDYRDDPLSVFMEKRLDGGAA
jgi:GNAT superfamily N-acetyltransferase